jgi:hypothetical protein
MEKSGCALSKRAVVGMEWRWSVEDGRRQGVCSIALERFFTDNCKKSVCERVRVKDRKSGAGRQTVIANSKQK